jgi:putative glutamine amidotransferase
VAPLSRPPVIGYTLELEDPLLPHVEPALREPLERFGALAVVLPRSTPAGRADALLDLVDGVLLSGGADVHPRHYGEEVHALTRPIADPHDAFEIGLARAALDRGTPVLGICRGVQVMAVADGGRLTQDVETLHDGAHRHRFKWVDAALDPPGDHWHEVECVPGSGAERWLAGGPSRVNSFHHQSVAEAGRRLAATARPATASSRRSSASTARASRRACSGTTRCSGGTTSASCGRSRTSLKPPQSDATSAKSADCHRPTCNSRATKGSRGSGECLTPIIRPPRGSAQPSGRTVTILCRSRNAGPGSV